ncbi:MAG: rhodanese-like domain-containing protein [Ignavibacteriales bacterium]|nr:rhodanese-like domain-containing protein [Ignavibacteriales bacterium]
MIRQERILNWANDSLSTLNKNDYSIADSKSSELNQSLDSFVIDKKSEIIEQTESFKEPKAIILNFAYKLFNQGIRFIDARSPEEFAEGHIKNAINIPFYGSENYLNSINQLDKNDTIVTYCSSAECDISTLSGEELFKMGFKRVYVFVGGYDEWTANNYPINIKK